MVLSDCMEAEASRAATRERGGVASFLYFLFLLPPSKLPTKARAASESRGMKPAMTRGGRARRRAAGKSGSVRQGDNAELSISSRESTTVRGIAYRANPPPIEDPCS
jgi:hypothetical protein